MRLRSIWTSALVFALCGLARAQTPVTVGIPTAQFNFVSAAQLQTEWCWAASIQMILNWYNIPIKQSDVVTRIYGKTVDSAASENAIRVALSGTAYDRKGRKVSLHTERKHGVPPTQLLIDQLSSRRPMLVTFHSTPTMLHAVVLTSAEYVKDDKGIRLTALTVRDPNPAFKGRHAAATIRVSGEKLDQLLRAMSSYYLVTVKS
jgi:hypothetical protein